MNLSRRSVLPIILPAAILLAFTSLRLDAQVSPEEVHGPQLKAVEKAHLSQLIRLNQQIEALSFPFPFALSRYVGIDPKNQPGTDARGLEFVRFQDRTILKVSGNYNAAFNADLLTANQRANRVLNDIVVPILAVLTTEFTDPTDFDGFGFEISYHVSRHDKHYGIEGKENFVVVFDRANSRAYLKTQKDSRRQEILSASATFVNGKAFGLALGEKDPLPVDDIEKPDVRPAERAAEKEPDPAPAEVLRPKQTPQENRGAPQESLSSRLLSSRAEETVHAIKTNQQNQPTVATAPSKPDLDALQNKIQVQVDAFAKEGISKFHFVEYAPPSLAFFRDQVYLQLTMRNPSRFDKNATSIYKRAAQDFDLFLAPLLKDLLAKLPEAQEIVGLDITVLNQFTATSQSSEAMEYICPLPVLRHFADYDITNQDLINQSVVLVNGVRVSLNLQQVE